MKRRQFLALSTLVFVASPVLATSGSTVDFTPEVYQKALESGEPFMLDFSATWWPVCRAQERTVSALINGKTEYQAVKIIRVDWDLHRSDQFTKKLKIRRQSTLDMFKGGVEIDRVIAQTSASAIEPMFELAIAD